MESEREALVHLPSDVASLGEGRRFVARTLRERYGSARPALIAVTGRAGDTDRLQARAAGFEHHVAKPYEPRELLALIGVLAGAGRERGER